MGERRWEDPPSDATSQRVRYTWTLTALNSQISGDRIVRRALTRFEECKSLRLGTKGHHNTGGLQGRAHANPSPEVHFLQLQLRGEHTHSDRRRFCTAVFKGRLTWGSNCECAHFSFKDMLQLEVWRQKYHFPDPASHIYTIHFIQYNIRNERQRKIITIVNKAYQNRVSSDLKKDKF